MTKLKQPLDDLTKQIMESGMFEQVDVVDLQHLKCMMVISGMASELGKSQ